MKKYLYCLIVCLFLSSLQAIAEPIQITPVKKITTANKYFQEGYVYQFKDIKTNKIITGVVDYYRPNALLGQEAQIEISNFKDENHQNIKGKITIIPVNHKNVQEFMNRCSLKLFRLVRGSEITLLPNKNIFMINNNSGCNDVTAIKIKPNGAVSTVHDELEVGDLVKFDVVSDVYQSDKLLITANTPIYGVIDYLDENGWCFDNANIHFVKFITTSSSGERLVLNAPLDIEGFSLLKYKSKRKAQFFNYIGVAFRGKEVDIKPYDSDVQFNLIVGN